MNDNIFYIAAYCCYISLFNCARDVMGILLTVLDNHIYELQMMNLLPQSWLIKMLAGHYNSVGILCVVTGLFNIIQ